MSTQVAYVVAAALLMLSSGIHKRQLRWRAHPHRCPRCKRILRDCVCGRR
jgi:hypothetical protein